MVKVVAIIIKVICYFSAGATIESLKIEGNVEKLIKRLIELMHFIPEFSITRAQKETETEKNSIIKVPTKTLQEFFKVPENQYYEAEVVHYSQTLLLYLIVKKNSLIDLFYNYSKIDQLLAYGLIKAENIYLKDKMSHGIIKLLVDSQFSVIKPKPHSFIIPIILKNTLELAL
jgi:hypothetical protein